MRFRKITDYYPKLNKDEKVIWINFDKCAGYLDLKTGKYRGYGCD